MTDRRAALFSPFICLWPPFVAKGDTIEEEENPCGPLKRPWRGKRTPPLGVVPKEIILLCCAVVRSFARCRGKEETDGREEEKDGMTFIPVVMIQL